LVNGYFEVWYSDEHALALGVGTVIVKTAGGTTTTNYPIAPLTSNPGVVFNPAVGTTATTGDQAGTDVSGRPMTPSLFITDTTNDPNNRSGDWQWGGTAIAPSAVFGTWKSFTRTVDYTTSTPTVTVTVGTDPAKNNWNLGAGSDAPPAGVTNEGYGAEMRWNLSDLQSRGLLIPGHTYRFYVMVHDGDQNKVGGDAGQASFNYTLPAPPNPSASLSGSVYLDLNFNGARDQDEPGIAGVTIILTGTDSLGNVVTQTTFTDDSGNYTFANLQPGTYQVFEVQPQDYIDGLDAVGTVNGSSRGSLVANDTIGNVVLAAGDLGVHYDFGELLAGS
ncbi:MAG TPA: SdrD B-like domain-containing protein, partial [Gemmataceae bacterium]